jgi:hypothetical protein
MPAPRRVMHALVATATAALLTACAQAAPAPAPAGPPDPDRTASAEPIGDGPAPAGAATEGLVETPLTVPPGMGAEPLDVPRRALVPPGWSLAVWARVDGARLAAFAPDGALLVSRPGAARSCASSPGRADRPRRRCSAA